MTGHDGNVSPPASLHAGTTLISSSSAMPTGAGDGGRGMKWGNKPAFAGGSSAAIAGSPPHPSKSLEGREEETEGGEMKRKTAVFEPSSRRWLCCQCSKPFPSPHAVYGHMRIHISPSKPEKEVASILLELGQKKSNKTEGSETKGSTSSSVMEAQRKKIHMELDLNKEAPEDDENDDEDYGGDNGGA